MSDELLKTFLAQRHAECPSCRYDLRDLTTDRCPECNQQLMLAVRLAEPRLGLWIVGLVGMAAGAGFHGILGTWAILMVLTTPNRGPQLRDCAPLLVGTIVCGALLLIWIIFRRRTSRWSGPARILAAAALWVAALVPAAWFFAMIR